MKTLNNNLKWKVVKDWEKDYDGYNKRFTHGPENMKKMTSPIEFE